MTNKYYAKLVESNTNLSFFFCLFIYTIFSICMINLHLEKNDFGKDIKRTIKIRHYVNLIGW